jgi:hypothetical protein
MKPSDTTQLMLHVDMNILLWAWQRRCELCGAAFRFQPVYADNTPPQLTLAELAGGLHAKVLAYLPTALQMGLLSLLWLVVLPVLTSFTFEVYFCTSLADLGTLLWPPPAARTLVITCLCGTVLCTSIVVISVLAMNVREVLLNNLRALRPILEPGGGGDEGQGADAQALADGDGDGDGPQDDEDAAVAGEHDDDEDLPGADDGEGDGGFGAPLGRGPFGLGLGLGLGLDGDEDDGGDGLLDLREIIGLGAPLHVSLRQWANLCVYNVAFLTLFQFLPYRLGLRAWAKLNENTETVASPSSVSPFSELLEIYVADLGVEVSRRHDHPLVQVQSQQKLLSGASCLCSREMGRRLCIPPLLTHDMTTGRIWRSRRRL